MSRFSIDSFQIFNDGMGSAVSLRNVSQASHKLGLEVRSPDSGNPYDEVAFVTAQAPEFTLSVLALEQVLDLVNIHTGLCITNATNPGLKLFGQGHDPCGTSGRTSGSTNMQVTIGDGHLLVTGIECAVGADATATLRAIALSDAGAAPVAAVYNAALPATIINDEVFTLASPQVGGIAIGATEIKSVSLDTGIDVQVLTGASSIYPQAVLIRKSQPTIRLTVDAPSLLASGSIPLLGKACTHANSFIAFAKRDPSGALESLSASEHIKITFNGFATIDQHFSASGSEVGTMEINIRCTQPSGSVPLIVATDTALA